MYFSNAETRPAVDIESSHGSLRGTLKSLQVNAFLARIKVWCSFSLVDPVSNLQLYRPSITRVPGGSAVVLLSRCFSQFEESGYAGMVDHRLITLAVLSDTLRGRSCDGGFGQFHDECPSRTTPFC